MSKTVPQSSLRNLQEARRAAGPLEKSGNPRLYRGLWRFTLEAGTSFAQLLAQIDTED